MTSEVNIGVKILNFWGENGGLAIYYFQLTIEYWAKIKGEAEKKDEKLKKKLQNDKEKRKKRKKRRKIEKKDAKRYAICGVFSKSGNISSCVARIAYCVGE